MTDKSTQSEVPVVNGYRGIWYTLGFNYEHGDRYSGGLGTYTANHQPMAVYSERFQKTFFTYGGTPSAEERHLLIMLGYYDHQTGQVSRPVVVCDKIGVDDPHDNGAIQIDDGGYIYVFVSGRNTARLGKIYRSEKPGSIDRFRLIDESEVTYPQAWKLPGGDFFLLFTKYTAGVKGSARELYWKTSADGEVWSEDHKLAGFAGHYQVSGACGEKVGSFFNWHPESEVNERTNLYYVQTQDKGKTWTTVEGQVLDLPLDRVDNPALVIDYHAQGRLLYTCDLQFDAAGHPILLYVCSCDGNPGPQGDPREFRVTHWDGQEWQTHIIAPTTHNYDMGSLYIDGAVWRLIAPTDPGAEPMGTGGEVVVWESQDAGQHWERMQTVTASSQSNHSYMRRPIAAKDPFYAFWADGDSRELGASHLYFCDSSGREVYQLPYTMSRAFAKPKPYPASDGGAK